MKYILALGFIIIVWAVVRAMCRIAKTEMPDIPSWLKNGDVWNNENKI